MSYLDAPFIVVAFLVLIPVVLIANFVWNETFSQIGPDIDPTVANNLETGWDNNVTFFNQSYEALFIITLLIAAFLTIVLSTHPITLVIWLLVNMVTLYLYDALYDFLEDFLLTVFNTGEMNTAVEFFQGDMPKMIIIGTILMSLFMLGKKWKGGQFI